MRLRFGMFALLCAAVCLTACSSGSSFNTADLNPFNGNACCDPAPAQDPCGCAPAQVAQQPCDPCATTAVNTGGARPPDARPGEVWCYVRVPAITKSVCEQVCVQPERCDKVWVEPVTKEVCEQVCVQPEQVQCRVIPAQYEDVCEQVCTAPARNEWRKVDCQAKESLKPQEQIGECWTLVEIPPCYENRTRRVCTCPEKTVQDVIPAKYENRTRTVTVTPGYYKNVPRAGPVRDPHPRGRRLRSALGVASHDRVRGARCRRYRDPGRDRPARRLARRQRDPARHARRPGSAGSPR